MHGVISLPDAMSYDKSILYMVDVPVFVVAPEIVVCQKRSHHLSTRNCAMEIHQLPNQLNLLIDIMSPIGSVVAQW